MNWLKRYIDFKGLSINYFEETLGTRSTIAKAISNNSNLRRDLLAKIIEVYPEINPKWLLTGEGEMLTSESQKLEKKNQANTKSIVKESSITYNLPKEIEELSILGLNSKIITIDEKIKLLEKQFLENIEKKLDQAIKNKEL